MGTSYKLEGENTPSWFIEQMKNLANCRQKDGEWLSDSVNDSEHVENYNAQINVKVFS
jgi:hypothetical protein